MSGNCRDFRPARISHLAGVLIVAVQLLAGCATGRVLPPGSACIVNVPRAPFYKYGPAQSFGADMLLEQGARVTVVDRSMGFCRVMTETGFTGYVADDQLDPAPAEPPVKAPERVVTDRKLPRVFSAPIKRSNLAPTPGDPLFDMNDVPLPANDEPVAAPKPAEKTKPPEPKPPAPEPLPAN